MDAQVDHAEQVLVQETDKISSALAKAQSKITAPERNKTVTVNMKTGGEYKFKYATLDKIIETIREPLTANELWFFQHVETGKMITTLVHSSGQKIESAVFMPPLPNGYQEAGIALTYFKRYGLCTALGIAAEDDSEEGVSETTPPKEKPKPKKQTIEERADEINMAMKEAADVPDLDEVWLKNDPDLEKIKEKSPRAYAALEKNYKSRRQTLEQAD